MDKQAIFTEIDSEIEMHYTLIRTLKTRRNLHSPICTLPDELLCEIFAAYVQESMSHNHQSGKFTWITVILHICKQWRDVAIRCSKLWTLLPQNNIKLAKLVEERSNGVPLTLEMRSSPENWGTTPLTLDPKVHPGFLSRIRRLDLRCLGRYTPVGTFPTSMPALQELHLGAEDNWNYDGMPALPHYVFSDCPQLKILSLRRVPFQWLSAIAKPSLVELRCDHYIGLDSSPAVMEFRQVLHGMPALESIRLTSAAPRQPADTIEPVYFQHLKRLVIEDSYQGINTNLLLITHPPLSNLLLRFQSISNLGEFAALVPLLPPRSLLLQNNTSPIRTIFCHEGNGSDFPNSRYWVVKLYTHHSPLRRPSTKTFELDASAGSSQLTIASRIYLGGGDVRNEQMAAMNSILHDILTHQSRNLGYLESIVLNSPSSLLVRLAGSPNLHTITLIGKLTASLLCALGLKTPDSLRATQHQSVDVFRRLRILHLESDALVNTNQQMVPLDGEILGIPAVDFESWLEARAELGIGLKKLVFCGYDLHADWGERLRRIVPIVCCVGGMVTG